MRDVKRIIDRILSVMDEWLFPQNVTCLCCDQALDEDEEDGLCPSCAKALLCLNEKQEEREKHDAADLPEGICFVHAAYPYEDQARRLVHRLKFDSVRSAAVPLARQMAYLPSGEEELIVPVPTDIRRKQLRGYNQSTLLARHIADTLGMPMCEALVRVRKCDPQMGLPLEKRQKNLIGCMRADDTVKGKHILLVDDVYTSGSTAAEAARALLEAGAISVGVFAAARAGVHDERNESLFLFI